MKSFLLSTAFMLAIAGQVTAQLANWSPPSQTKFPVNISGQVNGYCRITQLDFHPTNPNKLYAITSQGGLFTTNDAGENWTAAPGTENMVTSSASICVDRTNDQVIYLGTGDPNYYQDGVGVYKSTNGGATFSATPLTNCLVIEILQHPTDPATFVAATSKGIYKSTNNGTTWTAVTATTIQFCDLQQNTAANSLILYAGTRENVPRLFRSTDFGSTWTQVTSGLTAPAILVDPGCRIAVTPADPNVVYFSNVGGYGMVFKSTDGGLNFTMQKGEVAPYLTFYDDNSGSSGQGNYNNTLSVDRNNPNKLWLQSQNTWTSTDGGVNWTMLSRWSGVIHTDHHYLIQSPYDANKLYSCNDGGVWLSTDGGNTWTPKSDGLYAYEIAANAGKGSHTDPVFVSIGTQDNGTLFRNSDGWYCTFGGDDYDQREFDYLPNGGYWYNMDDNKRTKVPNGSPTIYGIPTATVQAMAFNRTNTELGFLGNANIYRTTNLSAGSPTWTQISTFNKTIKAVHSCIADPDRLYVITSDQLIYVSTNATQASPTFNSYALPSASNSIASIAAICNNANTVYISINNKVYSSTDGGQNWTNITYNLPNVNHRKILAEEYGGTQELVFVATNNAVYYKKAGQTTWTNYSTNLPGRRSPTDFSMFDDGTSRAKIRYATYGKAYWETGFDNLRVAQADFVADRTNNLCLSNGVVNFTDLSLGGASAWSWSFPGGSPSTSSAQNPTVTYSTPGTYTVTLTITTPSGMLTVTKTNYITVSGSVAGGTYNVGTGGDFPTLTAAVAYWNSNCTTGAVQFNLTSATYPSETFPITINANSPTSSLTIKPTVNATISGSSAQALIIINGADRITIDGSTGSAANTVCPRSTASRNLTINNTNSGTSSAVVWIQNNGTDGATDNTIKNCTIIGNASTTTLIGLGSGNSTISTSSTGVGNDGNAFINNSIQKLQYGIYSGGESFFNKNQNTVINLNNIDAVSPNAVLRTGILVKYENNIQISGNTIANMNVTSGSSAQGIALGRDAGTSSFNTSFFGSEVTGATVTHNVIDNIVRGASFGSAIGIYVGEVHTENGGPNTIANNLISRINAPTADVGFYEAGIAIGGGRTSKNLVYNNTIHLTGTSSNLIQSYGILVGGGENYGTTYIKNNIFSNQLSSTARNYVFGINYPAPYPRLFSDYNDVLTTTGPFAVVGGLFNTPTGDRTTFNDWKNETGKDGNSKNVLPEFISSSNGRLNVAGSNNIASLFGKATPLTEVTNDVDCDARHPSAPTIGADENCAAPAVPTVSASVNPVCPGNPTTLSISSGALNSATEWRWYSGSCGGTLVGTGTSIMVSPLATTTYYVRGEGSCVTPGACASITVTAAEAPSFTTCPSNININTSTGLCTGVATYVPVVSGTSPITLTYTFTGATTGSGSGTGSGTAFEKGVTNVALTAANACGTVNCNFTVTVVDNEAPAISCPSNIAANANASCVASVSYTTPAGTDNCVGATTSQTAGLASGSAFPLGATVNTFQVTAANGQTNSCSFTVTVTDNTAPNITCKNATVNLNGSGMASINATDVYLSGTDNCGTVNLGSVSPSAFNCGNIGSNTVTLTADDGRGNTGTCTATVTVNDNTGPSVVCKNISVNLNSSGTASIAPTDVYLSGTDNCGTVNPSIVVPSTFNCSNLGTNVVTLTADDSHGNTGTCTATVTVNDNTGPSIVCKNISVNLNSSGTVSIAPADVYLSGTDNCGTVNLSTVVPSTFNCSTLGARTVTLTADDSHGNTGTCTATVTVADNLPPSITCKPATVNLNSSGTASIAPADVYLSGTDNCGTVNPSTVNPSTFNCSSLGTNVVTLTADDSHGNTGTCTATVTVNDNTGPSIVCKNISVNLNSSGTVSIAPADVYLSGTDNCGTVNLSTVVPSTFNCSTLGTNMVTLTADDGHGNTGTCTASVTVNDNTGPSITCKNTSVNLTMSGTVSISPADVYLSGTDNCGTVNPSTVVPSTFNCSNLGTNMVTLTADDGHGNTGTCMASVTVTDNNSFCNAPPTAMCKNITVNADGTCNASVPANAVDNGSSDPEMGPLMFAISPAGPFGLGATTVTLTVTDNSGLTATCTATITVADNTGPSIVCKNISVNLNSSGTVSIAPADVYLSGTDNCGTVNLSTVVPSTFNCSTLGARTVTLTADDSHGNTGTCTATVTVNDNTGPSITCKNISVNLNSSGTVSIAPADVYLSGTDNCGTVNPSTAVPSTFNCSTLGARTVTLTADDSHGNTGTCTATVTVNDNTGPSIVCKNISVNLNSSGTVSIAPADVYLSGTDNCGTVNPSTVVPSTFNCSTLGARTVTLTADDSHGNTGTCTATVTVNDNTGPSIVCKNISVNLNSSGTVSIAPADVYLSGTDNCGTVNPSTVVPSTFNCSTLGARTVTLTADDSHGNTGTCTATVTVNDNTGPSVTCKNISVNLNSAGTVSIAPADVYLSGTDNCGTVNPSTVVPSTFNCSTLGARTVTLTADDSHGNTGTCTATVTVNDNTGPSVTCKNISVNLNSAGTVSIAPADVYLSGTDNCGTVNLSTVVPSTFNCSNIGATTVTLTANDGHGNTGTCTATVTVADNLPPSITCKPATVNLNSSGTGSLLPADVYLSGTDNCGTVNPASVTPNSFNCSNIGATTVTLTANDGHGNTGTCTATVTVNDNTGPSIVCKNISVNLNSAGTVSIAPADVYLSGTDNCGTVNLGSVSPSTFNCSNIGATTVTLTANDGHGNTGTCTATVTVADNLPPSITCKPATVNLNSSGTSSLLPADVYLSGTDNCGTVNPASVTPNSFNCSNIGATTVTLTANDGHGNTGTCTATVTVADNLPPSITCKPATVNLNSSGTGSLLPADVYLSGTDNCGTVNLGSVSPSTFNCSNIGATTVTLTANDGHGNTGTCTATVTVADNLPPSITCKPATVNLNSSGTGSLLPADVYLSGTDNCGTVNPASVTPNSFNCSNIGATTVTLTANDGHGNTGTCTATVTVADNLPPSITCKPATVNLNSSGTGSLLPADVYLSGTDNCGTVNLGSVSPSTFNCSNIGATTVTLTANDGHGNTGTCTATVTVVDNLPPTVICKGKVEVALNSSGTATVSPSDAFQSGTDNCGTVNPVSITPSTYTCANLGGNIATLTVNDGHGNTATCTTIVSVADLTPPTMLCRNVTLNLDASGKATLTVAQVNNGSFDNCAITNMYLSQTNFSCANAGNNTVTLYGQDQSLNTGQCTAVVTIVDPILPVAKCKNAIVNLGSSGSVTPNPNIVDNGSSDNCNFTLSLTPATFTCANVGNNNVKLKITDAGGNSAVCSAVLTVKDASAPVAKCRNATVILNNVGVGTLTVAQIDNGTSDACGLASVTIDYTQFNCSDLGATPKTVTLTARDVYNNVSTCIGYVTVSDNMAPTAVCENQTVTLGGNGTVAVYGSDLASESTDNCSVWSYSPIAKVYTAPGTYFLTVTVKDWSANSATCVSQIVVQPHQEPAMRGDESTIEPFDGNKPIVVVYPNPADSRVMVEFMMKEASDFTVHLFDSAGRLLYERKGDAIEGENTVAIELADIAPGVYVVTFDAAGYRMNKVLVIQR